MAGKDARPNKPLVSHWLMKCCGRFSCSLLLLLFFWVLLFLLIIYCYCYWGGGVFVISCRLYPLWSDWLGLCALFVLLLSTLACCRPTVLIWAFFFCFINFPILLPSAEKVRIEPHDPAINSPTYSPSLPWSKPPLLRTCGGGGLFYALENC